ncbi:glycosyltransferase family 4 protein [Brumimicrobium oceani]|uniref:Glycosyl transferase family 1 domain-containing protein n=1 Tax=Brumimicrobium oceani TaxID=2100725 RepID=A0A2U2XF49_9FLAO|nr:glycosyltransferase family 4 protein [Brumimicrobium oceani]PWH86415.1 hypothetical protein DIT68_04025 [Brumimicrobium oceani]
MVLFLVNTFPSLERPKDGAFNLRAAKQLSNSVKLKIIHLRAWHPKRKFIDTYQIDGLDISVFSFPLLPNSSPRILGLQLLIYKNIFLMTFRKKLKNIELIHSVGASFSGVVGSYVAKKLIKKHIAQCIGSDINFSLPKLTNSLGIKGWENNVDYFGCNSNELAEAIKKLYSAANTKVVYRGVDLQEFKFNQQKFLDPREKIYLLFLGGLSYRSETSFGRNLKGGITVLKAWKLVIDQNPELNDRVELLYGGPETSVELLENKLETNNLNLYSIKAIGQLSKEEVKLFMQKAHIVLVPSMAEGLPNIAMEAGASGCVIIATDVGGTHEVVVDGYNGKLIQAGDINQLIAVIKSIIENRGELKVMGQNSRKLMEDKFDKKQFSQDYISLYNTILNKY